MWGHYTDCHRGFVIGFDDAHPFFVKRRSSTDEFGFLRKVCYRRDRPELRFDNVTDGISADVFQTKSEDWAYEREWRMMRILDECALRIEQQPHDICLFAFEPDAVKEIVVGMRAEASFASELRQVAASFPRASVFVAREHPSEYAIAIERVG